MTDRCPTCKRQYKRSNPANARYWLLLHVISEKVIPKDTNGYSAEVWHTYMKSRYLGCDEVVMPNGKQIQIPRSTANLPKDEFAEYAFKVEAWANEHGAWLDSLEEVK